jgi:hypothetical protein
MRRGDFGLALTLLDQIVVHAKRIHAAIGAAEGGELVNHQPHRRVGRDRDCPAAVVIRPAANLLACINYRVSDAGRPEPHGQVFMALSPFCNLDGTPMRGRNIGGAIKGVDGWWRVERIGLLTADAVHAHIGHGIVHSVFADGAFAVPARNAVVSCEFCFHEFCSISSGAMTPIACGAAHGHARQPDAWTRQRRGRKAVQGSMNVRSGVSRLSAHQISTAANVGSECFIIGRP